MKLRLFHSLDTTDWPRVFTVVLAVGAFWGALQKVVPEKYWSYGVALLAGATAFVTIMMKSGRSRVEIIDDKIEEHEADGVKKSEEIKNLVVNELKEKVEEQAEKLEEKK